MISFCFKTSFSKAQCSQRKHLTIWKAGPKQPVDIDEFNFYVLNHVANEDSLRCYCLQSISKADRNP